jgi:UDPglucose--hexose-1-phosphate uridylyltransferase
MSTDASTGTTALGNGVTRSVRRLADGREIAYYDAEPGRPRDAVDRRELDDAPTHTELRHDPLRDEWVVVAGHRQARTFLPPSSECPLCPTHGDQLTEVPEADYDVVVFENRFPSLTQHDADAALDLRDQRTRHGFGRCEVVCFTSNHGSALAQVTPDRLRLVLEAWIDRDRELSSIPGIEYVFVFENRGVEIGVTLSHPHGQIYGYPFVPPRDEQMIRAARSYRESTGGSLHADVIAAELADGERVVYEGEHWIAFVPRAARWPFELQMYTRRPISRLRDLSEAERAEFATMYLSLLRSLDAILGVPMPYIAAWHQAPVHGDDDDSRLFLEVFSLRRAAEKLKYLAGSESAAGVWINDISPEDAAQALREGLRQVTA